MMLLQQLIDKQDSFEIIRDQLAALLVLERENQKALALEADPPQDPARYDFRVYAERTDPWEVFQDEGAADLSPVVNIWYETSNFDGQASNISERQATTGIFNIDCIGAGRNQATEAGHTPADEAAALETHRALRLVRNIIMASQNTYLQLQGLVWQRWPQSVTIYQPVMGERPTVRCVGSRLALRVKFNEFSPQYVPENLELLSTNVHRASDGQVVANVDYQYPLGV